MSRVLTSTIFAGFLVMTGCGGAQSSAAEPTPAPATPPPASTPAAEAMDAPMSLADGVYTEQQADRGAVTFTNVCAECHAPREFWGTDFMFNWEGSSVGSLYRIMSTTMPEDDPGGLDESTYLSVLSYILQLNDYPAGNAELKADMDVLNALVIEK